MTIYDELVTARKLSDGQRVLFDGVVLEAACWNRDVYRSPCVECGYVCNGHMGLLRICSFMSPCMFIREVEE